MFLYSVTTWIFSSVLHDPPVTSDIRPSTFSGTVLFIIRLGSNLLVSSVASDSPTIFSIADPESQSQLQFDGFRPNTKSRCFFNGTYTLCKQTRAYAGLDPYPPSRAPIMIYLLSVTSPGKFRSLCWLFVKPSSNPRAMSHVRG